VESSQGEEGNRSKPTSSVAAGPPARPGLHGLHCLTTVYRTTGGDVNRECVCVPWNLLAGLAVAAGSGLVGDLIDDVLMRACIRHAFSIFQRVKVKQSECAAIAGIPVHMY